MIRSDSFALPAHRGSIAVPVLILVGGLGLLSRGTGEGDEDAEWGLFATGKVGKGWFPDRLGNGKLTWWTF